MTLDARVARPVPGSVLDLILEGVDRDPSAVALLGVRSSERLTYAELYEAVTDVAAALRARGVGPADSVLVSLPNGPAMLVATIGTMCAAACAPMNALYTRAELDALADDLGAAAVVTDKASNGPAAQLADERGLVCIDVGPAGMVGGGARCSTSLQPDGSAVALLLHTAGTTARPKQVPLTHANLVAAANNVVASLDLTPADRCLNVMPLFHSHGLLGAALSTLRAGASIVCAPGWDPRRFLSWANEFGCTWYTAASTIHQLVIDAPGEWEGLRFMRSASGPLVPQVASALEERFGAPMIEVYGMTEAYQIAANPLPPGERRVGSVGRPTGTEVGVLGADGVVRTAGGDGEIVVRGPAVFGGYSTPSAANADAFVDGWFRTGDLGRISDDGYLSITGRLKEQINRGGEKIAPREVEEALLDHPDIVEAMAFAIPDDVLGEEIGAAIVVRDGASIDLPVVRRHLQGRIAPFKVPRRLVVVDAIPKTSTGKPQRLRFAEQHVAELAGDARPPADVADDATTIERLRAMWQDILGLDRPPGPADGFFELGGTSLDVMELAIQIEEVLGVDLPILDVLDVPTLGGLATRIDELRSTEAPARLLRRYRAGGSGVRLVLVPGQFGMAVGLNLIADAVDADVDIWLFDYPGHRPGQKPLRTIDALAGALLDELDREGLRENLAFYGNSLGSWVVFEAARRLDAMGSTPLVVGIGDLYSPYFAGKDSPTRPPFVRRVRNHLRRARDRAKRNLGSAGEGSSTSPAVARQRAVVAASEHALRSYDPRSYGGDLLVVVADERGPRFGATLGWHRHVHGSIRRVRVVGGHSDMHRTQAHAIGDALSEMIHASGAARPDHEPTL